MYVILELLIYFALKFQKAGYIISRSGMQEAGVSHSSSQPPECSWVVIILFLEQAEQVILNDYMLFWKKNNGLPVC